MTHRYDLGDIFMREYSNGDKSYYMIIEIVEDANAPVYEILNFDDNEYDFFSEGWLNCLKKVG